MRLLINGTLIPYDDYSGRDSAVVDIVQYDDKNIRVGTITTEFTVYNTTFDLIKATFIDDPLGKLNYLDVKIYEDECCDEPILVFEGILRGDMVDWCHGSCEATVSFIEKTTLTEQYNCIKSTLVADNWNGFQLQNHPRVPYCIELRPDFLQFFTLSFASLINSVFLLMYPIVAGFQLLINSINLLLVPLNALIPGTANDIVIGPESSEGVADMNGYLDDFSDWVDNINQHILNCGRKHPSPFVRSYIKNVCDKCGLTFQSSILNSWQSPYYNTMYFNAPHQKGTRNNIVKYIPDNSPIQTLDVFLEDFKLLFNGEYTILNNVLIFERKDFFYNGNPFVVFQTLEDNNRIKGKLCYTWREEPLPALAIYKYTEDAVDEVGNEALGRYNDIVEWNNPYNPMQSGRHEINLPFGVPRFRDDYVDSDILGFYGNANFGGFAQTISDHNGVLIMSKGVASAPKVLIWDGIDINFANTSPFLIQNYNVNIYFDEIPMIDEAVYGTVGTFPGMGRNYPFMFNEINTTPNTAYPWNTNGLSLYGRFHAIDNPKLIVDKGWEFTFTMYYDCQSLTDAYTAQYVQLPEGLGRIKKMRVNLTEKTLEISGHL